IKTQTKDIWDEGELNEGSEFNDLDDPRPEPKYEMIFKQSVTPEDMFLQMGNKTTSTASCENLIVKIYLPGSKISEVNLDVKELFLDCRTPKYKLGLFLPHSNDPKVAKAQWNPKDELLTVTLKLIRDYDDFNF
ncbi:hypothetical protein HELRODRAFT_67100, partial [Helobdella robusta]|uniref:PIH1D1/2/3 CS-like domain-containing protein n=1 Tax=Helobdella robusta TaxID=6412 RepID=T1FYW4_HELRO